MAKKPKKPIEPKKRKFKIWACCKEKIIEVENDGGELGVEAAVEEELRHWVDQNLDQGWSEIT